MKTHSVKKNYVYYLLGQGVTTIIPMLLIPYVSRVFEPDGIGYYSFQNSVCSYFVLFAVMGTAVFGQRQVSFCQDSKYERSKVLWEVVIIRCIFTMAAITAWGLYVITQPKQNQLFLMILSIEILTVAVDVTWFFQGLEEFRRTAVRFLFFKLFSVALIFSLVHKKSDLAVYALIMTGSTLLGNLSLWRYLPEYICRVSLRDIRPFRNLKTIFSLFIPSVAISIYTVLDKTMVGYFANSKAENGYYEQTMQIVKTIMAVVTTIQLVSAPKMGYYYAANDKKSQRQYLFQSYRFIWFLGIPLSVGIFGIAPKMVPWFCGIDYLDMIPILQIASWLIVIIGINSVTGAQYMIPTEKQGKYTFTVVLGACCNFLLNLFFIPRYFALGAAFTSVIAETVILSAQFVLLRKEFSVMYVFRLSKNYIIAGICMGAVLLALQRTPITGLTGTLWMIVIGSGIYAGILACLKDDYFITLCRMISAKIHKHIKYEEV